MPPPPITTAEKASQRHERVQLDLKRVELQQSLLSLNASSHNSSSKPVFFLSSNKSLLHSQLAGEKYVRELEYRSGGESETSNTPLRGNTPKYTPFYKKNSHHQAPRDGLTSPVMLNCMSNSIESLNRGFGFFSSHPSTSKSSRPVTRGATVYQSGNFRARFPLISSGRPQRQMKSEKASFRLDNRFSTAPVGNVLSATSTTQELTKLDQGVNTSY